MSSGNVVRTYEELIEKSEETISDLEFDLSSVIIPYSEFIKPLKNDSTHFSETDIKKILKKEIR